METDSKLRIAIIGLGYVGLPLAVAFSRNYPVIGYDINAGRVASLLAGNDHTQEVENDVLQAVLNLSGKTEAGLQLTADADRLRTCNVFIVTVPTPVTSSKIPDLKPLLSASSTVGKALEKGDIVIYESTVYPGCTEEDCVPVLERESGLTYNTDFFCGYSPERINPGDKVNTLATIRKVVSGSTPAIADKVAQLYASIVEAGVHKASSIKVAEASKAIENAQRDVNISFMNELALIFDKMGIDTQEVLEAAATKWNFLRFSPGLVGGHCIGVDPYYLLHKSQQLGYNPQVILSGRSVNDSMGRFVAAKTIKLMIRKGLKIVGSRVLVLGFTFKENCPDTRNTKVIDVVRELEEFGVQVDVYDPFAIREQVRAEYGLSLLTDMPAPSSYDGIIVTVSHDVFKTIDFKTIHEQGKVVFDTKALVEREWVDGRL